jgi:hypothetical protein
LRTVFSAAARRLAFCNINARVHAPAECPSRCSSVHICTAKCSVYRMPENLREPIGVQWQMMCCPDARERIRIYGGTFGGITNA